MELRAAAAGDLPAIQALYAHHVLRGLATFEEVPPDVDEMRRRHAEVAARGLPYLVAVERGEVLGYGYSTGSLWRRCIFTNWGPWTLSWTWWGWLSGWSAWVSRALL